MRNDELSPEVQNVYDIICNIGAITTAQIARLLNDDEVKAEKSARYLCGQRYTKWIDEKYSVPFHAQNIDFQAIACLWVMLDMTTNKEGKIDMTNFEQLIPGSGCVKFTYVQGEKLVVNMIYINDGEFSKVVASKQRFYDFTNCKKGEESKEKIVYLYVTSSKKMVATIQDMELSFPHKIAYVDGDNVSKPKIKYY